MTSGSISGSIPTCILIMPKLQVLHLSGNSLTSTLPSTAINWTNSFRDLSLSFNLLKGHISTNIDLSIWTKADFSNNRFSGTISSFQFPSFNLALSLRNNRLSGYIPSDFHDMINIDILEGNFFNCKYDRSDLPSHDSYRSIYDCGSNSFNVIYYLWLGMLTFIILFLIILWYNRQGKMIEQFVIMKKSREWMLFTAAILQHDDNNTSISDVLRKKVDTMIYLQRYVASLEMIKRFSCYSTLFIIIILLPIYSIISSFYNTHNFEYAWTVGLMFLSGKVAFGVAMSAISMFIVVIICVCLTASFHHNVNDHLHKNNHQLNNNNNPNQIFESSNDIINTKSSSSSNGSNNTRIRIWCIYFMYTIINLIIVSGVNIAYIIITLTESTTIILFSQLLLSIFKLLWNNVMSSYMVRWIVTYLSINDINQLSTLFFLQFIVSIVNNIIIPCLMVLIISPHCFYHVFQQESDVTSDFYYTDCTNTNQFNACTQYTTYKSATSYSPPFNYSYQCSSTFITYYSPVFMIVCIISTFIIPFLQGLWLSFKMPNILPMGQIFYPSDEKDITVILYIDEIYKFLVHQLSLVTLILTFGVIFPPLAAAFMFTICVKNYYHHLILGRYITNIMKTNVVGLD